MKDIVVTVASSELQLAEGPAATTVSVVNRTTTVQRIVLTPVVSSFTPAPAKDPHETGTSSSAPSPATPGPQPTVGPPPPGEALEVTVERALRDIPAGLTEQYVVTFGRGLAAAGRYDLKFIASPSEEATEEYADRAAFFAVVVPPAETKPRPKFPWWLVAAGAALVAAIAVTVFLLWPHQVAVPNVVGRPEAQAKQLLTTAQLQPSVTTTPGIKPLGVVVSQQPAAGTQVDKDSRVTVVVRSPLKLVPLTGQNAQAAQAALKALGYTNVTTVKQNSLLETGTVIAQQPVAGALIALDDPITLTVALQTVEVPGVVGLPVSTAMEVLKGRGLVADLPSGCVILCGVAAQNPPPGTPVAVGTQVTLVTRPFYR